MHGFNIPYIFKLLINGNDFAGFTTLIIGSNYFHLLIRCFNYPFSLIGDVFLMWFVNYRMN